jgi:hypothetical protein
MIIGGGKIKQYVWAAPPFAEARQAPYLFLTGTGHR